MADWYRRKTWTKEDEREFYLKLGRARRDDRGQYLKGSGARTFRYQRREFIASRGRFIA